MEYRISPCLYCGTLNKVPLNKLDNFPKCGKCKEKLNTTQLVYDVNYAIMENVVANSPIPVVIDFWAPWCGPCLGFAPVYKQFAQSNPNIAIYLKFNSDNEQHLIEKYNIRSIPTIVLFGNGIEKARQSGAMPLHVFENWLKQNGVFF